MRVGLACILVACSSSVDAPAPPPVLRFRVEASVTRAESIRAAMAEWSALTSADIREAPDAAHSITVVASDDPRLADDHLSGFFDPSTGNVLVREIYMADDEFRTFVLHELGHACGLAHLPYEARAVMSPWPSQASMHLTRADLDEYEAGHSPRP